MIRALNGIVCELAPAHVARGLAPSTLAELMSARDAQALPVWDGASDGTMFGDARVNHAFRAWHDATHIAGGYAFDVDGEAQACEAQCRQLLARYPRAQALCELIRCEINGQAAHFARTGQFPTDQLAFARDYLAARGIKLER